MTSKKKLTLSVDERVIERVQRLRGILPSDTSVKDCYVMAVAARLNMGGPLVR